MQIKSIAEKHGTTPGSILLKWAVQRGTSAVPKSTNPEHIRANLSVLALPDLSDEEMHAINTLKGPGTYVRFNNPKLYFGFDIYNEDKE